MIVLVPVHTYVYNVHAQMCVLIGVNAWVWEEHLFACLCYFLRWPMVTFSNTYQSKS